MRVLKGKTVKIRLSENISLFGITDMLQTSDTSVGKYISYFISACDREDYPNMFLSHIQDVRLHHKTSNIGRAALKWSEKNIERLAYEAQYLRRTSSSSKPLDAVAFDGRSIKIIPYESTETVDTNFQIEVFDGDVAKIFLSDSICIFGITDVRRKREDECKHLISYFISSCDREGIPNLHYVADEVFSTDANIEDTALLWIRQNFNTLVEEAQYLRWKRVDTDEYLDEINVINDEIHIVSLKS